MVPCETMRWYAAKTKAGQDAIAIANLTRQSFQVYYPQFTIKRWRNKRIAYDREPLFPGYVLVNLELETMTWKAINNTRGVLHLLSFAADATPTPLPVGEIERLMEREKQGKLFINEVFTFRRGDQIRLKVGPSVDQIGQVIRTRGERVEFLMYLLGRNIRCIAPSHTLQLVGGRHSSISAEAMG